MCVVSAVFDYGQKYWPITPQPYTSPIVSPYPNVTIERVPTAQEWAEFMQLVEKARKFDEIARQLDCEDPSKLEWFEAMQAYMDSQKVDDPDADSSATKL